MTRRTLQLPTFRPGIPLAARSYEQVLFRRAADLGHGLLALGAEDVLECGPADEVFHLWRSFLESYPDWSAGWLSYDLKNCTERLHSRSKERWSLPLIRWFVPRHVVEWSREGVLLHTLADDREVEGLIPELLRPVGSLPTAKPAPRSWNLLTSKEDYLRKAGEALWHLKRGDVYEVNLCVARAADWLGMDPYGTFDKLLQGTDAPFAAFGRWGATYTLCASPERYLRLEGQRVFSEPMKGTRPRDGRPEKDLALAEDLQRDAKERAENVMATDVVRNDIARVAAPGTVQVDELCGVRTFSQVHQMVSVVSAQLAQGKHFVDLVRATFPMASMTGAPKIRAMELIDRLEDQRREWFSGSMGWIAPGPIADLNVVIRSVQHDARTGVTELLTGSALTAHCDPMAEWDECSLKADTVLSLLHGAA